MIVIDVYTQGGYITYMKPIQNRLRRVEGQITSLQQAIEREASCEEVIPQFLAAKGALDAALQSYLKASLATCQEGKSVKEITAILDIVLKKLS
jgi:DNA-binding FrmR family transcriptional regulator